MARRRSQASQTTPRRRTSHRLFEGLQEIGYNGAYESVQRFVKRWKSSNHGPRLTEDRAFVELLMLAGEAGLDALTVACELTLECGVVSAPIVMNELRRLIAPHFPVAAINVPDGMGLP